MTDLNAQANKDEKEPLTPSGSELESESDLEESEMSSEAEAETDAAESKSVGVAERPAPDPRFDQPTPSPYKRAALIIFTILLFWIALSLRGNLLAHKKSPKVIYASRWGLVRTFGQCAHVL
jgi:hypothetical protein